MDELDNIIEKTRTNQLLDLARDHENRLVLLETASKLIKEIHLALLGSYDKKGLIAEIKEHTDFITACKVRKSEAKKAKIDWSRWGERLAITSVLAYLMAKGKVG